MIEGGDYLDKVISKVAEIDAAAIQIMDQAAAEKKVIAAAMNQATVDYDQQLQEETQHKIKALQDEMAKKRKAQEQKLYDELEQNISSLDAIYQEKHEAIANYLLKTLISG